MKQPNFIRPIHIKRSAYFLIATGILHTVVGFIVGFEILSTMVQEGLFNTTQLKFDREAIYWFLFSGFAIILGGLLVLELNRIPKSFSWSLLLLSLVGIFIMPVTGLWLVIPQAIYMIWHQNKATTTLPTYQTT